MDKILVPILALFFLMVPLSLFSQSHKGKCKIEVIKTYSQKTFGRNIGYYVELKNNSNKTVDAIEWEALFYNKFGELKGKKPGKWDSGNIIEPVDPGGSIEDLETSWIKDATDVYITIKRVHYTDGTSCK